MSDELNTPPGPDGEQVERLVVQAEVFVAKYRHLPDPPPKDAAALKAGIRKDLLSLAAAPTKLLRKTVEIVESALGAVGNFLTGTSHIPEAMAQRIRGNRALADAKEDQAQAAIEATTGPTPALPPPAIDVDLASLPVVHGQAARHALEQWLDTLRARGIEAHLYEVDGSGFLLVYGSTASMPQLLEAGVRALKEVKALPPPQPHAALPMPQEDDDDTQFPGLDPGCAAALKAASIGPEKVLRMTEKELRAVLNIGPKRAATIRHWLGTASS